MKRNIYPLIAALLMAGLAAIMFANIDGAAAQAQKANPKFEAYRTAIKDAYQVDIVNFKDKIKGGYADGKAITDYDLAQLIQGIKWEREHTNDSLLALEMAMDHLERIPDYYTHLIRMEYQCESEKLRQM
jgi:endoglucanase Acf2